jgi:hypothetical protein
MAQRKKIVAHVLSPQARRARNRLFRRPSVQPSQRTRTLGAPIARDRAELELKRAVRQTARLSDLARKLKRAIAIADKVLAFLSTLLAEREARRLASSVSDGARRG